MKVQDPDFPPDVHPTVRDFADNVVTLLNGGGIEFTLGSSAPTDSPDAQTAIRIVGQAGTGNVYVYVWNKTTSTWRGLQFTLVP